MADRYISSVIVNHAAVHGLGNDTVAATIAPFTSYLAEPDLTVYLRTSLDELAIRMRAKPDLTQSDRDLLADRALLERLQNHYDDRDLQPRQLAARPEPVIPLVTNFREWHVPGSELRE